MLGLSEIKRQAGLVELHRKAAATAEAELQRLVGSVIAANRNGLRDWARTMGISAQYACDIRHGRRKISDTVLKKLLRRSEKTTKKEADRV